jgi:dephospho-CoA kinase
MIRLGLTGSIGMGKSTIAKMFVQEGIPVWDADEAVHRLYKVNADLKTRLCEVFGDILTQGHIDRAKLSLRLKEDPSRFEMLNQIVHPIVVNDRKRFEALQIEKKTPLVVADIPLLFETGADKALDKILVVTAPFETQKARVLARPDMTEAKFQEILKRQMPDSEKRKRAHYIIDTSRSLDDCLSEVKIIINSISSI